MGDLRLDDLQAEGPLPVGRLGSGCCKERTFGQGDSGAGEMLYNVAQLLKGPVGGRREYDVEDDIRGLDPELVALRPLTGTVTMLRTRKGILVGGKLQTTLLGTCRRCLEPTEVQAEVNLEEEFYSVARIGEVPVETVPEEEQDDALLINDRHILDLREVVRQALWLSGSMDTLCRPDCAGLCPHCGGNRNLGECTCEETVIDPRWAALRALQTE